MIKTKKDLAGMVFGRWTVLWRAEDYIQANGNLIARWVCQCSCGSSLVNVRHASLLRGASRSCGCLQKEVASKLKSVHGKHKSRTYVSWCNMCQRCNNHRSTKYECYGGRGITVCDRWLHSFENFLEDMGECPEGMTLDRIDVNGNYEPSNCRWITCSEQSYNQRKKKTNTSGRTGVSRLGTKGRWKASIKKGGKVFNLGTFKSFEEAVAAREAAELALYGYNLVQNIADELLGREM